MKITASRLLAMAALGLPVAALAGPWYAGIAAGQARTSDDLVTNRESTIIGAFDVRSDFDRTDTAWKVFAGYRLHRNVAIEASYADLGEARLVTHTHGGPGGALPGSITLDRKLDGFGADVLLIAPFEARRFNLFAKAGAFRSRVRETATLEGGISFSNGDPSQRSRSTTQRETVLRWGVGAEWDFTPNVAVRLEWERYSDVGKPFAIGGSGTTGEADTDAAMIGVLMRF